jgi:hypothetical protein
MTRLLRLTAVFLVSAPLLLAAGCKQGKGDRCQVESDCEDGLTCILSAGSTPQAGGTCQISGGGSTDMAAGPGADLAGADLATTPTTD